jgi:LysM repeat protein
MAKLTFPTWFFLLAVLAVGLTGCELTRSENQVNDIDRFVAPTVAIAQTNAVARLEPATSQLNMGGSITVQIRLDNVANLSGVDLELRFNPTVLQVQDLDPAEEGFQIQPGDFLNRDFVADNSADNAAGIIYYSITLPDSVAPVNGSGLLASVTFRANNAGISDLFFEPIELFDNNRQPIQVTRQSGQVIVNPVAGQPTPTFTLVPGQPTPTPTFIPGQPTPTITPPPVVAAPTLTPTATLTPTPTPTNTPAPPAVQIPPGATVGFCYRVQWGETLYSLGQKFGLDPQFIALANDLYPPGHVYAQKVLFMPTQYGTGPNVYMVQPNDTLALVAEQCQLDVDVLAFVNNLTPATNLENIPTLIIPRPPFAPPARYPYPQVGPPSVWPPPCAAPC